MIESGHACYTNRVKYTFILQECTIGLYVLFHRTVYRLPTRVHIIPTRVHSIPKRVHSIPTRVHIIPTRVHNNTNKSTYTQQDCTYYTTCRSVHIIRTAHIIPQDCTYYNTGQNIYTTGLYIYYTTGLYTLYYRTYHRTITTGLYTPIPCDGLVVYHH